MRLAPTLHAVLALAAAATAACAAGPTRTAGAAANAGAETLTAGPARSSDALEGVEPAVVRAAAAGDVEGLKALLARGASPDSRVAVGTALQHAVELGQVATARVLLEAGAKGVNELYGPKVKHRMLSAAAWRPSPELVKVLLAHGADVAAQDEDGGDALAGAAVEGSAPTIELLLAAGADPNRRVGANGLTAVIFAARQARPEALKVLLDRGGDPERRDHSGRTPLIHAAAHGREEAVKLLLDRRVRPWPFDAGGLTALAAAKQLKDPAPRDRIVALLAAAGAKEKPEVRKIDAELLVAAGRGDVAGVKAALARGADLHVRGFMTIGVKWYRDVLEASIGRPAALELLLEKGADPNGMDLAGFTAMHAAARDGKAAAIQALAARGGDPNLRSRSGMTPLFVAVKGDSPAAAAKLLELGADPNAKDPWGAPLVRFAREHGRARIVKLLLAAGAKDPGTAGAPPAGKQPAAAAR